MIEIENLTKDFGAGPVLDNVSLKVKQGEVVAIIGPSGSGKSSLLRCINFLDEPSSGKIKINGVEVNSKNANKIRQKVGMVFQSFNLFPHMTVKDNLTFAPVDMLKISQEEADAKANDLLRKVGLENKADVYPHSLSGGQKQRVAIARSLMIDPDVLLFDEPTSALDPEVVKEVQEVIKSFAHTGITMILVTHEMNFAKELADRIFFLDHGKVIEESKPKQFFSKPKTKRAQEFLSNVQWDC